MPRHFEAECAAEEAALRAATARDSTQIADFKKRTNATIHGLQAVQKAAEEAILERDWAAGKQNQGGVKRTVRAAGVVLLRSWNCKGFPYWRMC